MRNDRSSNAREGQDRQGTSKIAEEGRRSSESSLAKDPRQCCCSLVAEDSKREAYTETRLEGLHSQNVYLEWASSRFESWDQVKGELNFDDTTK